MIISKACMCSIWEKKFSELVLEPQRQSRWTCVLSKSCGNKVDVNDYGYLFIYLRLFMQSVSWNVDIILYAYCKILTVFYKNFQTAEIVFLLPCFKDRGKWNHSALREQKPALKKKEMLTMNIQQKFGTSFVNFLHSSDPAKQRICCFSKLIWMVINHWNIYHFSSVV